MPKLDALLQMSRHYGSNSDYVLAGGGNTSLKIDDILFVKASGTTLATIEEDGFVAIDRHRLQQMWKKQYSPDSARRESEVLADLMASRIEGQTGRPSVETALHDLMEYRLVLHLHPALLNGLTCSLNNRSWVEKNLGEEAVWLDATKPGYLLAAACRTLLETAKARSGKCPQTLLIENHGVFFAADHLDDMAVLVDGLMGKIRKAVNIHPDFTPVPSRRDIEPILRQIHAVSPDTSIVFDANRGIRALSDYSGGEPEIRFPFTPDHIVYCGPYPLYTNEDRLTEDFRKFVQTHGFPPKAILVRDAGLFALGKNEKMALLSRDLFLDEIKILAYSKNFGGPRFMTPEDIDFIIHWEVENYRVKATQK